MKIKLSEKQESILFDVLGVYSYPNQMFNVLPNELKTIKSLERKGIVKYFEKSNCFRLLKNGIDILSNTIK